MQFGFFGLISIFLSLTVLTKAQREEGHGYTISLDCNPCYESSSNTWKTFCTGDAVFATWNHDPCIAFGNQEIIARMNSDRSVNATCKDTGDHACDAFGCTLTGISPSATGVWSAVTVYEGATRFEIFANTTGHECGSEADDTVFPSSSVTIPTNPDSYFNCDAVCYNPTTNDYTIYCSGLLDLAQGDIASQGPCDPLWHDAYPTVPLTFVPVTPGLPSFTGVAEVNPVTGTPYSSTGCLYRAVIHGVAGSGDYTVVTPWTNESSNMLSLETSEVSTCTCDSTFWTGECPSIPSSSSIEQ